MKKILIIEDETTLRKVLADTIGQSGFMTIEADDGEKGLRKAFDEHPDLILLDLLMPKMDGLTMLKKIRDDIWGQNIPVIILTNVDPQNEELSKITEYRAAYYLIKTNVKMDQIIDKIKELLEEKH